jgi:hypothetical protein
VERLAEDDLDASRDGCLRWRPNLGGEQDQQDQDDGMAGDRQRKGQPYLIHDERAAGLRNMCEREYRHRPEFAAAVHSRAALMHVRHFFI